MSEYQYYEFQAVDKPLDQQAMSVLRGISSRATISPTQLVNVYHYGDFKGNPHRLMEEYFDAFVYVANWGNRRLMLRLPRRLFDLNSVEAYLVPEVLEARATAEHVILDFDSQTEGYEYEDGEGWMTDLLPLRSDLLAGDLRCLYVGWLWGVESGAVEDDTLELPVPPGLGDLSPPLIRLAKFLRVDQALIEAASAGSAGAAPATPSRDQMTSWLADVPETEKNDLLLRLMEGETNLLVAELRKRCGVDHARSAPAAAASTVPRRSAGTLVQASERLAAEKSRRAAERAAQEKARQQREQAEARARYLATLAGREDQLWRQVKSAIATKKPKEYDRALALLTDLADLAKQSGDLEKFAAAIRKLRQGCSRQSSVIRRLNKAGFPK